MAKVDIANKALSFLGEETILTFNDEVAQARVIKIHYDSCKRSLLQQHNWNFATKRVSLTQLGEHEDDVYPYAYQYPSDCIKIIRTDVCGDAWARFQDKIYSHEASFPCEYIAEVDESYFSPSFEEALVYYIASKICHVVSGDTNLKNNTYQMYGQALLQAIAANDLEQGKRSLGDAGGQLMRRGFYGTGLGVTSTS